MNTHEKALRRARAIGRDQAGAAIVCAMFFAFFMAASALMVHAFYEAIITRENLQDAADATAFMAAVIHAKAMNLIVLIHVIMAAVLAIMVGLRLVESLCIVAMGICSGLAVPTYGASLAYVPTLADLTNTVHDTAEDVRDVVNDLLPLLHDAAEIVVNIMPLSASASAVDATLAHYGVAGVAIPTRMTLPLEDGSFGTLCRKAGDITGGVVAIPFAVIPPVRAGVDAAVEAIVSAGPEWFCGGGDRKPELKQDAKAGWVSLPKSDSQTECEQMSMTDTGRSSSDSEQRDKTCSAASVEMLAATPARDGSERTNEPLCPVDCAGTDNVRCPPRDFADCVSDDKQSRDADTLWGSSRVPGGEGSPYTKRVSAAREDCGPDSAHAAALRGFSWVERTVTRTYRYDPQAKTWNEDEALRQESTTRLLHRDDDDSAKPCGSQGLVATEYVKDPEKPLCHGNARCVSADGQTWFHDTACDRAAPLQHRAAEFVESETEVVNLLGCGYQGKANDAQIPDVDVTAEAGGNSDSVPLQLVSDALLGGDAFQIRGIAMDLSGAKTSALDTASLLLGQKQQADVSSSLGKLAARLALAQAEHFFDWSKLSHPPSDQNDAEHRIEWMWNMGWTARLRSVQSSSDDESDDSDSEAEDKLSERAQAVTHDLVQKAFGKNGQEALSLIDAIGGT